MLDQFKKDVRMGLSSTPKKISSKYFYDKKGDVLFQKIMELPEYYLTRAELEIFQQQSEAIIKALEIPSTRYFQLIELGAGDGTKTKELLKVLIEKNYQFDYFPIDISKNILYELEATLKEELPEVSIIKKQGRYFEMLESLKDNHHPKVVLFLGSNLGNLSDELATKFIYRLGANLQPNDILLLGVDLIKPASIILPAYSDDSGVTSTFNLNLLARINDELGGNFNLDAFEHLATYDEYKGVAKSFLVSKKDQKITINALNKSFDFSTGEKIHTEISRKYNEEVLSKIFEPTDFKLITNFKDVNGYFADYIYRRC